MDEDTELAIMGIVLFLGIPCLCIVSVLCKDYLRQSHLERQQARFVYENLV
jgi:hypothetical protein